MIRKPTREDENSGNDQRYLYEYEKPNARFEGTGIEKQNNGGSLRCSLVVKTKPATRKCAIDCLNHGPFEAENMV